MPSDLPSATVPPPPAGPTLREPILPGEPHLFRFSLRRVFVYVSLVAAITAMLARLDGAWPMVIGICALLMAAHVFGTSVGTRLRDASSSRRQCDCRSDWAGQGDFQVEAQQSTWGAYPLPEITPLALRSLDSRLPRLPLATGLVIGLGIGWTLLYLVADKQLTIPGWALGGFSCGAMGAGIGVVACNCFSISRHAIRHATRSPK